MTVVNGKGAGNTVVYNLLDGLLTFSQPDPGIITAVNQFGSVAFSGSNFAYTSTPVDGGFNIIQVTNGTITGVSYMLDPSLESSQLWTGFNLSAVTAFDAVHDFDAFHAVFFGGDDTFNWTKGTADLGTISLYGFGGNDVFNIADWSNRFGEPNYGVDGGSGNDTLNISGGISDLLGESFNAVNIEAINLGSGFDYTIQWLENLANSGSTLTVDGSSLGASNSLTFVMHSTFGHAGFGANLVIYGGAGDDLLQGGAGSNSFNGGAGIDTVSFESGYNETGRWAYNGPGVTANLSLTGFQTLGGLRGGSARFNGIENLIGSQWNDDLTGDAGNNVLDGGLGTDILNGGDGDDKLIGAGTLNGGNGDDTLILYQGSADGGTGIDVLVLDVNWAPEPYLTITHSGNTLTIQHVQHALVTATDVEFIRFNDRLVQFIGPVMTTTNAAAARNQSLALSSLFSAVDLDGDPVNLTAYELWDSNLDPLSGHFVVSGVAQAAGTVISITAAQLAQTSFVTGRLNDTLRIRAFDGSNWSAPADSAYWTSLAVTVPGNIAPVVTTANTAKAHRQSFALSGLFTVSDADGDSITKYQLMDGSLEATSGYFTINGAKQTTAIIEITASQLGQTAFVTGTTADILHIRAFDGISWSAPDYLDWAPFTVSILPNNAPVVTTSNITKTHGQSFVLSGLFSISDADGDTITKYQLWDSSHEASSGYFTVNGVRKAAGTVIEITASQLAQTAFVTGLIGDSLQIRAFDGIGWSAGDNAAWAPFTVGILPNNAPAVTTSNITRAHGQSFALSGLFSVSDADSDTITKYQLWDGSREAGSGYFTVNGVKQAAGMVIEITAAQLAQTSFVTGSTGDSLQIRAFDGIDWSAGDNAAWAPFAVGILPNNAPVVTTSNTTKAHFQNFVLSSLFSVSDADSDTMTRYQLWDASREATSGYFIVNGVKQAAGTVIEITAAQLAQTSFVTGATGDNLQIRAFDGIGWSAGDNAAWAPFTVTVPANRAPVVTTSNLTVQQRQNFRLSDLFWVSDQDGDSIQRYQLWDSNPDASSGSFLLNVKDFNGVVVQTIVEPAGQIIDVSPAQLSQILFVSGTVSDTLQIRAYDGMDWSAADNAAWAPFTVTFVNHAPVVTTADISARSHATLALSNLFSVNDIEGDPMTRYQLWDSNTSAASGHFVVNGVAQAAGRVIDIMGDRLAETLFVTGDEGDSLQIRAFDGADWSAGDSASWAPFNIAVIPAGSNHAPVVSTSNLNSHPQRSYNLEDLFTVADTDLDAMARYQLWDSNRDPSSGYFVIGGKPQAAGTVIDVSAAQLKAAQYITGTQADGIQIRAYDGMDWSAADNAAWTPFTITPVNHAPVISTSDVTLSARQSVALTSLISVNDVDGDIMTRFQLWDSTSDPQSGRWMVNGVVQTAGTVIDITAAQLTQTSFLTGTLGDSLQVRAFDGISWSAADTAAWAPFHINV